MTITTTHPVRVYADTSVYGGVFDDAFATPSRRFFDLVRQGRFRLVVSAIVLNEVAPAPEPVRELLDEMVEIADTVVVTDDALRLQQAYLDAGIVTPRSADDALHVALATVGNCGLIVSWNFRHIVHYQKVPLYNAVNALHRRPPLEIRSPSEVIEVED
jgi:predicted nucleic acid-binding protein